MERSYNLQDCSFKRPSSASCGERIGRPVSANSLSYLQGILRRTVISCSWIVLWRHGVIKKVPNCRSEYSPVRSLRIC